jgi:hypothetical protein
MRGHYSNSQMAFPALSLYHSQPHQATRTPLLSNHSPSHSNRESNLLSRLPERAKRGGC